MVWNYCGIIIFRKTTPGYQLPYTARTLKGLLAADTLKGIRELIKDAVAIP